MAKEKTTITEKKFYLAVGRRKTAVARVRLYPGKGDFTVNGKPVTEYFKGPYASYVFNQIFKVTNTVGKFSVTVLVTGSGPTGQLGAVSLGIARALCEFDPNLRVDLRKNGFTTRDPRMKERKKPGLPGARKKKSSPKR